MDFVRKWWYWLVLAVVPLVLLGVHVFVTRDYANKAAAQESTYKELQQNLTRAAKQVQEGEIPTKGDIAQEWGRIEKIREHQAEAMKLWERASSAMAPETMHEFNPEYEFAPAVSRLCEETCRDLAIARARHEGVDNPEENPIYVGDPEAHQLANLMVDYRTMEDTEPLWRRFQINRRIHKIVSEARVKVAEYKVRTRKKEAPQPPQEGVLAQPAEEEMYYEPVEDWRMVERLGEVSIGEPAVALVALEAREAALAEASEQVPAAGAAAPPAIEEMRQLLGTPKEEWPQQYQSYTEEMIEEIIMVEEMRQFEEQMMREEEARMSREGGAPGRRRPEGPRAPQPLLTAEQVQRANTYYDRYPVRFEVVAHLRVVQDLMRRMLASANDPEGGMMFVPRSVQVTRYSDQEVRPEARTAPGRRSRTAPRFQDFEFEEEMMMEEAPSEELPSEEMGLGAGMMPEPRRAPGRRRSRAPETAGKVALAEPELTLRPDHEPPVLVVLEYDVYNFRFELIEGSGAGESARTR